jgi:ElaB/YqjD/DUF883 family membrane-anchored ribosome-binding protein
MTHMDTSSGSGAMGAGQANGDGQSSPKEMATAAVQTIKQEAASFADSAQEKARDRIDQGKEKASSTLGDFANAIRSAGDQLSQNDQSLAGRMVKQAADGLEGLSRSVAQKRPEELLDSVRQFGRTNPTAFIAGSVLVGLALGRFGRASGQHQASSTSREIPSQDFGGSTSGYQDPVALASAVGAGSGYTAGSEASDDGEDLAGETGMSGSGVSPAADRFTDL